MTHRIVALIREMLPKTVRRHRIWRGPLRRRYLYASWTDYPRAILGHAEPELVDWLYRNAQSGEVWLDVGAHFGYTALALSLRVGATGRVYAFEPVLTTAGYLAETARANSLRNQIVVPFALSNIPELTLETTASRFRGMAQMKHPTADGEPVFAISLDRLWTQTCHEPRRVAGIKIDVQGMEAEVVEGMTQLLRRDRPRLVIEYHAYGDVRRLLESLSGAGYATQGRPLTRGLPTEQLVHGQNYEFFPTEAGGQGE